MTSAPLTTRLAVGRRKGVLARLVRHRSGAIGLLLSTAFLVLAVLGP